ncbi:MAG: hypothetical protein LQ345_003619 [Seirophora villosa]|nr:MAG: hypothetical protein LQ345_003619 [Seirophora villosa]
MPSSVILWQLQTVDHVYLEATPPILETAQNPWTVLSSVDHKPESPSLSGQRPSWVPRWDEGWYVCRLGSSGNWYRAGGTHASSSDASVAKIGEIPSIQAMLMDTTTWCSRTFAEDELRLVEHQVAEAPMQQLWQDLQQQEQGSMYGQTKLDCEYAFSLTIAAGNGADGFSAGNNPAQHWFVYQEYQRLIDCGTVVLVEMAKRQDLFWTKDEYDRAPVGYTRMVIRGATVPFVVRKTASVGAGGSASNRYRLVGEAYVQGIMRGELYNGVDDKDGGLAEETTVLEE